MADDRGTGLLDPDVLQAGARTEKDGQMEAGSVKVSNSSAWSWSRAREAVLVLAAVVASFGVLIAGVTYAVQPVREDVQAVREDVRVLQATMGDVRERLVGVEKDIEALKEGQARILALLERRGQDSAS